MSMLSIDVPSGFGRSRSPKIEKTSTLQNIKRKHESAIHNLHLQLSEKDNIINKNMAEKEELYMRINELENNNEFLQEQVELVQREKETSIELLETQLKRQENEYTQQINIIQNEKQSAKNMLSHLQRVIESGENSTDSVVKKLNFSVNLNKSGSNQNLSRFYPNTTPHSPQQYPAEYEEAKINKFPHDISSSKNKITNAKWRSRNPSASGLKLISHSIPVKGFKNSLYRESHRSGNLKTLKELGAARNMANDMHYLNNEKSDDLLWSENQMNHTHNDNGMILNTNQLHLQIGENSYKRSVNSKSKAGNISDGGNGLNYISDIHPHSKEHSDDVNGTLMNSIVNLFPNKFRSNKGSGLGQNENGNPVSSFSSASRTSLSKKELQDKLEMIQRNREDSKMQQLRDSSDSNYIMSDSPERSAQFPYTSTKDLNVMKPIHKVIDQHSYQIMLETGEIMKNINGDILCKKCNREFSINQFITDENHWKICLGMPIIRSHPQEISDNGRMSLEYSEEDQTSEEYIKLRMNPNVNLWNEQQSEHSSLINPQINHQIYNEDWEDLEESYEEEDGEYDEDLEEGVPYEAELDNYELYSKQQRNNRYERPQVILETVEQESDEYRSSIGESTNYVSQQNKLFNKEKQASKPPSMRYHSQRENQNEVGQSVQVQNRKLNQSPTQYEIHKDRSEQIVHSSLESNNSKGSKSTYSKKIIKKNYKTKGKSEVSVRLEAKSHFKNNKNINSSNNDIQVKSKKVTSPRAFKDITYKIQPENNIFAQRKRSVPPPAYKNKISERKTRRKVIMQENMEEVVDDHENENNPVGYARIDLMNDKNEESESDSIPYDHLNSKLSRIEDCVNFFYEKWLKNYTHCINEVGSIKDYIEVRSERKCNSRMNSAYSNQASALKTPIQNNKFMEFHMSSKKKNPLDNHLSNITSQKKYRNLGSSKDATPEVEYFNQKNEVQEFVAHDEYNIKDLSSQLKVKDRSRKVLSRNNSGYGPTKVGLNRYNSFMSQSSSSILQHPATRSFALHL